MSANADVLRGSEVLRLSAREVALSQVTTVCEMGFWNPEDFAREQIRGLVRRVFFAGGEPVKKVVFSAAETNIDVASICSQAARALALETRTQVALVDHARGDASSSFICAPSRRNESIRSWSTQMETNLWRVPGNWVGECGAESGTGLHWLPCLEKLQSEFEYIVVQGPAAGVSSEAILLGQLTDGIILVLSARSTRKATARKIKETLDAAHCRILGTVLSERTFPIPEQIYRRL